MSEELAGFEPVDEVELDGEQGYQDQEQEYEDGYEPEETPTEEVEGEQPQEEEGIASDDFIIPFEFQDANGNLITKELTYDEIAERIAKAERNEVLPEVNEYIKLSKPLVERHQSSQLLKHIDYYHNQGWTDEQIYQNMIAQAMNQSQQNASVQEFEEEDEYGDPKVRQLEQKLNAIEAERQQALAMQRQAQIDNQNEALFTKALSSYGLEPASLTQQDNATLGSIIKELYPGINPSVALSQRQWEVIAKEFAATKPKAAPAGQARNMAKEKLRQFAAPRITGSAPTPKATQTQQSQTSARHSKRALWESLK